MQKYICDIAYDKTKKEIQLIINDYEGIVIRSRFRIDKEFIDSGNKLQFIARAGSGLENIDIEYAKSKNIICYNAPEGNRQAVAEHSLGMLLSLLNNLNKADQEIRDGKWNREVNRGIELNKKTVGIIGFGNNGSSFAKLLNGFGVKLLAYDKYLKNYPFQSSMKNIFEYADILSLHVPLTEETKYLINDYFINNFYKNIYVINTSRGKCADIRSIVKGIKNGKIKGACLDVLEYESTSFENLSNNRLNKDMKYLLDSKKTILSPHIARNLKI